MKRLNVLLLFFVIISFSKTFATIQENDLIIYKGDTLQLNVYPLEMLYNNPLERPKFFGDKKGCFNTACWRGYQAEWQIIGGQLYLTNIYSCCYREDKIKANLKNLFGDKYVDGKVKADWVTDTVYAMTGKYICPLMTIDQMVFEGELEFRFINGKLTETKTLDNSKTRISSYSQDEKKLIKFIYSNIKWNELPTYDDKTIKVMLRFTGNENGMVDHVEIIRSYDSIFDKEAIRVIKSIPEWDVKFRHGKLYREYYNIPITFSKENRERYKN